MQKFLISFSVFMSLVVVGCSSAQKTDPVFAQKFDSASVKGPVALRLGAQKGTLESVRNRFNSVSESFEEGAIRLRQEQGVEFTSKYETLKSDDKKLLQIWTTADKQGQIDLHTLAMPEVGERLEMGLMRDGKILMAGGYPQQSMFFVPQVSLPSEPVVVGDTWDMEASWVTLDEGVPLTTDVVSILKGFVKCGSDTCADIELSGETRLDGSLPVGFKNELRGRLLFAVNKGVPVWSHIISRADYSAEAVQRTETSCLETVLEEPAELKVGIQPMCKTTAKPQTPPPGKPAPESAAVQKPETI